MSHRNPINRLAAAVFVSAAALTLAGCDWTTGAAEPPKDAEFNFPERGRRRRARPVPGHHRRLQRLPHARSRWARTAPSPT